MMMNLAFCMYHGKLEDAQNVLGGSHQPHTDSMEQELCSIKVKVVLNDRVEQPWWLVIDKLPVLEGVLRWYQERFKTRNLASAHTVG